MYVCYQLELTSQRAPYGLQALIIVLMMYVLREGDGFEVFVYLRLTWSIPTQS